MTEDFQVFVKPVGARCNLRCSYCYYWGKGDLYDGDSTGVIGDVSSGVMGDETLERYVRQHYAASSGDTVLFTWHGGEPLLAGIDFFERAVAIQKRYLPEGKSFLNGIQTNGTLVTEEWADFLAANGFVVGVSMDGPEVFHDATRYTLNPRQTSKRCGSFEKTLNGYKLLRERGVYPEVLCVVNVYNVRYPLVVYDFFKGLGVSYITFLPLVEKVSREKEAVTGESVPAFEFGLFLSAVFDEWVEKDIGRVKIQIFEEALRTAFDQEHSLCIFRERCGGVPVIERNGNFYSCDHFVEKGQLLGNIHEHELGYFLRHPAQKAFGDAKRDTLPQYCIDCKVRNMCNGECPRNRFITSPDGESGLNYLCDGYQYFFNHCKPFVDSVSEAWKREDQRAL